MKFTTTVHKAAVFDRLRVPATGAYGERPRGPQGDGRGVEMTAEMRRAAIGLATSYVLESFTDSDLCPITVADYQEWGPENVAAATITLEIHNYGTTAEVLR